MHNRIFTNIICGILILSLLLPLSGRANDNPVKNVSIQAGKHFMQIRYDLLPDDMSGKYTITLAISDDGGKTYRYAVGRDITPGVQKRIVWTIDRDFPIEIDTDRYRIEITAKRQGMSRTIFYSLIGALVAGGGALTYLLLNGSGGGDGPDNGAFPTPPGRPQ